jgi:hypothetical protein
MHLCIYVYMYIPCVPYDTHTHTHAHTHTHTHTQTKQNGADVAFFLCGASVSTGPEKTIQEAVIAAGSPPNMRSITASLRGVNGVCVCVFVYVCVMSLICS